MQVQLFRIDDRLIHGQVVLGWAKYLGSSMVILCDDEVARNEWEKELYLSCVPAHLEAQIMNIRETSSYLNDGVNESKDIIVLVKSPAVLRAIIDEGYVPDQVNIGGIHYGENRKKILSYVFLSEADIRDLKVCREKGISIYCQDVPNAKIHPLNELIDV
jgi:mannose/fructose/N-acetylgalactosamine-specific phosphotransferase system component IIB